MGVRIRCLTFLEDDLKRLIEKTYPRLRKWVLNQAEENLDDWNFSTIEYLLNNEAPLDLNAISEEELSNLMIVFFDFLNAGKTKIKYKYYPISGSLKTYKDDIELIQKYGSPTLQTYWRFLMNGRSIKNQDKHFCPLENEPDFRVAYFSSKERMFIVNEIKQNVRLQKEIKDSTIHTIRNGFEEIGTTYEQVVLVIS